MYFEGLTFFFLKDCSSMHTPRWYIAAVKSMYTEIHTHNLQLVLMPFCYRTQDWERCPRCETVAAKACQPRRPRKLRNVYHANRNHSMIEQASFVRYNYLASEMGIWGVLVWTSCISLIHPLSFAISSATNWSMLLVREFILNVHMLEPFTIF